MAWTAEKAFDVLIQHSKDKEQMEYNLGRSQIVGLIGYSVEKFHEKFYPDYSDARLKELSDAYSKAIGIVLEEQKKNEG